MVNMERRNHSVVTEFILLGFTSDSKMQNVLFVVFLVSYLAVLAVNGLLILAVSVDHSFHKPMYFFLMNLSIIHVSSSSAFVPKMLVIFSSGKRRISFTGCAAQLFLNFLLGSGESISLLFMAYDRYVAICKPLRYNLIMSILACTWMITVTWTVSSILASLNIFILCSITFCGPNTINHFYCAFSSLVRLSCSDTFVIEILTFVECATFLLVPLLIILFSYYKIIASINGIRCGRYRVFSSCLPHLIVVTLSYGLGLAMFLKPKVSVYDFADQVLSVFFVIMLPILNPIIYFLKNEDVLKALRRFSKITLMLVTI